MNLPPARWVLLHVFAFVVHAADDGFPKAYAPVVAEARGRQDEAQKALAQLKDRQAELSRAQQAVGKQIEQVAGKLRAADDPAVAEAGRRLQEWGSRVVELKKAQAVAKAGAFATLGSMLALDRLTDELGAATTALDDAQRRYAAALRAVVRRDGEGIKLADAWEALEVQRIAVSNEAIVAQNRRDNIVRAENAVLRVIGAEKAVPAAPANAPVEIDVAIEAPSDAAGRREAFGRRGSPESLDELGRTFFSQMTLTLPGLETVRGHVDAGRFPAALEAYKRYFFSKLTASVAEAAHDDDADLSEGHSSRVNMIFAPPTQRQIEDALAGVVRGAYPVKGGARNFRAALGQAGAIRWVFVSPQSLADKPDAEQLLEFCRSLGFPGGMGVHLLHSYAIGGPVEHLRRWAEFSDDWAMNWQRDVEASPLAIRNYHLLYVARIEEMRGLLRNIALMRPAFVDDLPAATLARLLMVINEEYLASAIRLGRSGLYNFRIMAHQSMIPTSLQMQEFHAHQWALREAWRQVQNNFIYKIRRDGANFEFANDGHENTDQFLYATFRQFQQAAGAGADWLDPFWESEFLDDFVANTRYRLHNLRPDGWCYRLSVRDQRFRYLGADPEYKVNLLLNEPETRARLWKVFGAGTPQPPPAVRSESLAFQGYYYLRGGWEKNDDFVYFQNIGQPILSGREEATGFSLFGQGIAHLLAPPTVVDGRVQNLHSALILNPGGKAPHAAYGRPDIVKDARFLSDDSFDLVEGTFKGPYTFHRPTTEIDVFGSYGYESLLSRLQNQAAKTGKTVSQDPITDVAHSRLLISVQGRHTWLVADFIHSPAPRQFTQNYTLFAPVRIDNLKERLQLLKASGAPPVVTDAAARQVFTRNVGLPNLRMRHVTELPLRYTLSPDKRRDAALAEADPKSIFKGMPKLDRQQSELSKAIHFSRRVAVDWTGKGDMALLTLLSTRDRTYSAQAPAEDLVDLKPLALGADAAGFTAHFADGTPIAFAAAASARPVALPGLSATARALLICGKEGLALDCTFIAVDGKPAVLPPAADFRFRLDAGVLTIISAIHRPISPVTIEPTCNTFIDSTTVTLGCPTPGVNIYYTLDGTRPTPASPRYTSPIGINSTCRLLARAFRDGVTADIWQQDGTHATVVSSAVFKKQAPLSAIDAGQTAPGLRFEYFEGPWTQLMVRSANIPAVSRGQVERLFDVSARTTDGAFGMRYDGFISIPRDGVYTFHAPREMMFPDVDCGYDLRVFVDGKEWYPADRWHNNGQWSIALKQGAHRFRVIFTDLRPRTHKVELMWGFPHPDFTWKGKTPGLEMSGPGLVRGPIPQEMLLRPQ